MYRSIICSICRNTFSGAGNFNETISGSKCGHIFHQPCIEQWMKTSNRKCPHCKTDLESSSIFKLNFDFGVISVEPSNNRDAPVNRQTWRPNNQRTSLHQDPQLKNILDEWVAKRGKR